MSQPRNGAKRPYRTAARAETAAVTRRRILTAARELFVSGGYSATSMADVARRAGVNVDTLYATVGRKPVLLRALIESAISGVDEAVPAEQRDYVRRIRQARGARTKLGIYAEAIGVIQQRLAPLFLCLSEAARGDPESDALWREISERRARNMRDFAADLRGTGELRADLTDDEIADIVWSMNGAEFYALLVRQRGWSPERFAAWLSDAWARLLLAAVQTGGPAVAKAS
jgi:AcrR family transcriptional regulator